MVFFGCMRKADGTCCCFPPWGIQNRLSKLEKNNSSPQIFPSCRSPLFKAQIQCNTAWDTLEIRTHPGFTVNLKGLTLPACASMTVIALQQSSCLKIRIRAVTNRYVKEMQNICAVKIWFQRGVCVSTHIRWQACFSNLGFIKANLYYYFDVTKHIWYESSCYSLH